MRFRNISLIIGSLAAILLTFISDPDLGLKIDLPFGAQTFLLVKSLVFISLACLLLHISSKTLFDYVERKKLFDKAMETSTGSGLALLAISVFVLAVSILFGLINFMN